MRPQSVAVYISPTGGQPEAVEHTEVQFAAKDATPAGVIAIVRQIQARDEGIDDAARVVLSGPEGNRVKVSGADDKHRSVE